MGLATATVRHSSASILRRIGGQPLEHNGEEVPAYNDHHYGCSMEIMRFYSWSLNPRYDIWIDEVAREVRSISVFSAAVPQIATAQPEQAAASFRDQVPRFVEKIREAMRAQREMACPIGVYPIRAIPQPALG